MGNFEERWFKSTDGLNLYYREYGQGHAPVVLCLHGLTRNSKDFDMLARHLSGRYRVLAADVRGRGRSDRDPDYKRYALETYVEDTMRLLEHAGAKRFGLIGTSMGGLISMIIGASQPERVWSVVLNDIGPVVENAGLDRIKGYIGRTQPPDDWTKATMAVKAVNAASFPDFSDEDWQAFTRRLFRDLDGRPVLDYDPMIARAVEESEKAAVPQNLWALYDSLDMIPILALRGELSDLLSNDTLMEMKARHSLTKIVTVPRVGHAPTLDEPEAVEAIDRFLDVKSQNL